MKHIILAFSVCALFLACHNNAVLKKAEDPEEAAREFIRATLDGDYDKALFFLYRDSMNVNQMILDKWKTDYDGLPNADKVNFKDASIIVKSIDKINDSSSLFNYSNSYKNKQQTIKVIRTGDSWLVDLKDPFTNNMNSTIDSLMHRLDTPAHK